MIVPNIVALGIVFSGFSTFPAGTVALSRPKKAHKVNVAVTAIAPILVSELGLNGMKLSILKKNSPPTITTNNGINFKSVVATCNFPDSLRPLELIHVKNQIAASPNKTAYNALVSSTGKKTLKALTNAMATAALETQIDIQYPQATKKPAKLPIPSLE